MEENTGGTGEVKEEQRVNEICNNSTNGNFGCFSNFLTYFKQYIAPYSK